jgi:prepilin-type N-terminal cleavage/methylation domain-containing protein
MKNKKGFTLIELLVVVLIIGILAGIALPQYRTAVLKSKAVAALALLKSIYKASERYRLVSGTNATNFTDLDITVGNNCSNSCIINDTMFNINSSDTYAFLNGIYNHSSFCLAVITNDVGVVGVAAAHGVKIGRGSIICYTRNNSAYEKVCLALGGKNPFTHSSGKAYVL